MSVTAWRIVKHTHSPEKTFGGEGARIYGGRWSSRGVPVVYTAQSQSLAVLEMLVHLDNADLLLNYIFYPATFPDYLVKDVTKLDVANREMANREVAKSELPRGWQSDPAPAALRSIGDAWVASGASAVLRVPSAPAPAEWNYLLNPKHADFRLVKIGSSVGYRFDPRRSERG